MNVILSCTAKCWLSVILSACSPDDNQYAHPLDLLPMIDLNLKQVVRIDKHSSGVPDIPADDHNYHKDLVKEPWRSDIKPYNVVQPEVRALSLLLGFECVCTLEA